MKTTKSAAGRRGFLLGAGAAGAAGAAVLAGKGGALSSTGQAQQVVKHPKGGGGYHASEHVRRYYRSTMI